MAVGFFLKNLGKMKDKIHFTEIGKIPLEDNARLAMCWNILRTCTDEQLASLEKQVDAIVEENTWAVGVFIGPTLPL